MSSAYIPPHLRKKLATATAAAVNTLKRGVRFIGNATGNLNIAPNAGTRHKPRSPSAAPKKVTLKAKKQPTPNKSPVAKPTHKVKDLPPKYREMLVRAGKTKRVRKHKSKRKHTRRVKKHVGR
jgi:hypothetical protein